jgi:hypothetical protein
VRVTATTDNADRFGRNVMTHLENDALPDRPGLRLDAPTGPRRAGAADPGRPRTTTRALATAVSWDSAARRTGLADSAAAMRSVAGRHDGPVGVDAGDGQVNLAAFATRSCGLDVPEIEVLDAGTLYLLSSRVPCPLYRRPPVRHTS